MLKKLLRSIGFTKETHPGTGKGSDTARAKRYARKIEYLGKVISNGSVTVVVVDDDLVFANMVKQYYENENIRVLSFQSPEGVLEAAKKEGGILAFIIGLKDIGRDELLVALKEHQATKIIVSHDEIIGERRKSLLQHAGAIYCKANLNLANT